jgi:hypothetical protein
LVAISVAVLQSACELENSIGNEVLTNLISISSSELRWVAPRSVAH